jgi:hypothetical protein
MVETMAGKMVVMMALMMADTRVLQKVVMMALLMALL